MLPSVRMDVIPLDNLEPEPEIVQHLSEHAQFMRKIAKRQPKLKKKDVVEHVLLETFDLLGGLPAMAAHFDERRDVFYPLMLKHLGVQKSSLQADLRIIRPALPPTELDGPVTDAEFTEVSDAGTE